MIYNIHYVYNVTINIELRTLYNAYTIHTSRFRSYYQKLKLCTSEFYSQDFVLNFIHIT